MYDYMYKYLSNFEIQKYHKHKRTSNWRFNCFLGATDVSFLEIPM